MLTFYGQMKVPLVVIAMCCYREIILNRKALGRNKRCSLLGGNIVKRCREGSKHCDYQKYGKHKKTNSTTQNQRLSLFSLMS